MRHTPGLTQREPGPKRVLVHDLLLVLPWIFLPIELASPLLPVQLFYEISLLLHWCIADLQAEKRHENPCFIGEERFRKSKIINSLHWEKQKNSSRTQNAFAAILYYSQYHTILSRYAL